MNDSIGNRPELPGTRPTPRFLSVRAVVALMLREMATTYGRSPGGYVWAVLQPIGIILLLSVGFSLLIRSPSLGTSFILFYATGYLPFELYNNLSQKIATSVAYSRPLLAYPRITWIDTVLARFTLNILTLSTVFCILFSTILYFVNTRTVLSASPIMIGMAMSAGLGLGVGVMNCLLFELFPVWKIIWTVVSRPLFLASGVIFIFEDLPRFAQSLLWWNPLMHTTGLVRQGFFPTYDASYVSLAYGFGVAMTLTAAGFMLLRANYLAVLEK